MTPPQFWFFLFFSRTLSYCWSIQNSYKEFNLSCYKSYKSVVRNNRPGARCCIIPSRYTISLNASNLRIDARMPAECMHMHAMTCIHARNMLHTTHACIHSSMHMHTYIYTRTHTHTCAQMHACNACMHRMHTCTRRATHETCMRTSTHIHTCAQAHIHARTHPSTNMHAHMHAYVHNARMHPSIHVHAYTHTHTYIHTESMHASTINARAYTYMHTHACTHTDTRTYMHA
jgi:hypothetical protein